ncbi:hypothetical protein PISMIDRAFT_677307 [Pisolithus microcarpus 441]|uniref:Uncharacterized protein n=1 Tax=Pisolithus microcarpus 441 TaxID=765257 RepID=A0A0C9Z7J1_9AGAM|nr:hypothetical protein PISMIDRAFT_677307 [Pisolithus microcarpus 441]
MRGRKPESMTLNEVGDGPQVPVQTKQMMMQRTAQVIQISSVGIHDTVLNAQENPG